MAKVAIVTEIGHSSIGNKNSLETGSAHHQKIGSRQGLFSPNKTIHIQEKQSRDFSQGSARNRIQNKVDGKDEKSQGKERFEGTMAKTIKVANEESFDLENQDSENSEIYNDSEKILNEENAKKRDLIFATILENRLEKFLWIDLLFYPFAIIISSVLFLVPFCLFPAHDLVRHPEYWYEILFHNAYFVIAANLLWNCFVSSFLNTGLICHSRPITIMIFVGITTSISFTIFAYYIWTELLNYQYPIPFWGILFTFAAILFSFPVIWHLFPYSFRKNPVCQRRMKYYILWLIIAMTIVTLYQILLTTIEINRGPYQPLIALIFPVLREFNYWLQEKMIKNTANGDERRALIVLLFAIQVNHNVQLCYIIGSVASDETTWVLMAIDFMANMYLVVRIVWIRKKHHGSIQRQKTILQELVVAELVEFYAPLSFILGTALAYFTPIGIIVGNISNGYWAYHAIEDIGETLRKMGLFFLMDFTSAILSATILWFSCKINLWNTFAVLQKEFFKEFIVVLGITLLMVSS